MTELHKAIITAKRWDSLVQNIIQSLRRHDILRTLFNRGRNHISYLEMIFILDTTTNTLKEKVNVELINNDTRESLAKRNEFFRNLMDYIDTLKVIDWELGGGGGTRSRVVSF